MIADEAVRRYTRYITDARDPRHWTAADSEATAELIAAQARRLHQRQSVIGSIETLAGEIVRADPNPATRDELRRALDLPLIPDRLDTDRRAAGPIELLTTLARYADGEPHQARVADLLTRIPELVIADAEVRHFARRAQAPGVDTLLNQMSAIPLESARTRKDLADHGLRPGDVDSSTARAERRLRAQLHRDVATALGDVPQSQLTANYLQQEQERLRTTPNAAPAADLIRRYLRQRDRTAAIDRHLQTERRIRVLREQADRMHTLVRQRDEAPAGARARIDDRIRALLTEITDRFEPVAPETHEPQRPLHDGVPNCVPTASNRLVAFRSRRGKLPESWPRMARITEPGLAGVRELETAAAVDADWQEFGSLDELVEHVRTARGAALGALVFRDGGHAGGHVFEIEYEGDRLIVHEWVDGKEEIFAGDRAVRRWLEERKELGILRVHGIVVDENGDAAVPFVKDDRLAVADDLPNTLLAGLPQDGDPSNSIARDRQNREALQQQRNQFAGRVDSARGRELAAVEQRLSQVDYTAARRRLGEVRLLEYNRSGVDGDRGRALFLYGNPATAGTVLGIVTDTDIDLDEVGSAPGVVATMIAEASEGGSVAAYVMYRYDGDSDAHGRAAYDTDLTTVDATVLVQELERTHAGRPTNRKPRIELVGRGDGSVVVEIAREQMVAAGIDAASRSIEVADSPLTFPLPETRNQSELARAEELAEQLWARGMQFEDPETTLDWLYSDLEGGELELLGETHPELLADRGGMGRIELSAVWRALLRARRADLSGPGDTAEARRLDAFASVLDRAWRATASFGVFEAEDSRGFVDDDFGVFEDGIFGMSENRAFRAPEVRPLALPLDQGRESRSFVLLDGGEDTGSITVFVTHGPSTPDTLRAALHRAHQNVAEDAATRQEDGTYNQPHTAVVWQGTDAARLARDLATLVDGYLDARITFVVDGSDGAELVHGALADERITEHSGKFESDDAGTVEVRRSPPPLPPAEEAFLADLWESDDSAEQAALQARRDLVLEVEPRPELPRLPEDPETVRERAKQLWEALFGGNGVVDREIFLAKWDQLDWDNRRLLVAGVPEDLADQPGAPTRWRDRANRMLLARELSSLAAKRESASLSEAEAAQLKLLHARRDDLAAAARIATTLPGHPHVYVLSLGLAGEDGTRRMALSFDDIDTTRRVHVRVAGRLRQGATSAAMESAAMCFVPQGNQAVLVYLGADNLDFIAGELLTADLVDRVRVQRHWRQKHGIPMSSFEVVAQLGTETTDIVQAALGFWMKQDTRGASSQWDATGSTDPDGLVPEPGELDISTHELPLLHHRLEGGPANCTTHIINSQRAAFPGLELPEPEDAGMAGRTAGQLTDSLRAGWHPESFVNEVIDGLTADDRIAAVLRGMGPGATAVVVDEYDHFDRENPNKVGSHASEWYVDAAGAVRVRNWVEHDAPDRDATEIDLPYIVGRPKEGVLETFVIFRNGDGTPAQEPATTPGARPRTRIGRRNSGLLAQLQLARLGHPAAFAKLREILGREVLRQVLGSLPDDRRWLALAQQVNRAAFDIADQRRWPVPAGNEVREWIQDIAEDVLAQKIENLRVAFRQELGTRGIAESAAEYRTVAQLGVAGLRAGLAELDTAQQEVLSRWLADPEGLEDVVYVRPVEPGGHLAELRFLDGESIEDAARAIGASTGRRVVESARGPALDLTGQPDAEDVRAVARAAFVGEVDSRPVARWAWHVARAEFVAAVAALPDSDRNGDRYQEAIDYLTGEGPSVLDEVADYWVGLTADLLVARLSGIDPVAVADALAALHSARQVKPVRLAEVVRRAVPEGPRRDFAVLRFVEGSALIDAARALPVDLDHAVKLERGLALDLVGRLPAVGVRPAVPPVDPAVLEALALLRAAREVVPEELAMAVAEVTRDLPEEQQNLAVLRFLEGGLLEATARALGVSYYRVRKLEQDMALDLVGRLPPVDVRAVARAAFDSEVDPRPVVILARHYARADVEAAIRALPDGAAKVVAEMRFGAKKTVLEIAQELVRSERQTETLERQVARDIVRTLAGITDPSEKSDAAGSDESPPTSSARKLLGKDAAAFVRQSRNDNAWELAVGLRRLADRSIAFRKSVDQILWRPDLSTAQAAAELSVSEQEFRRNTGRGLDFLIKFLTTDTPRGKSLALVEDSQEHYPDELGQALLELKQRDFDQWQSVDLKLRRSSLTADGDLGAELGIGREFVGRLNNGLNNLVEILAEKLVDVEHDLPHAAGLEADEDGSAATGPDSQVPGLPDKLVEALRLAESQRDRLTGEVNAAELAELRVERQQVAQMYAELLSAGERRVTAAELTPEAVGVGGSFHFSQEDIPPRAIRFGRQLQRLDATLQDGAEFLELDARVRGLAALDSGLREASVHRDERYGRLRMVADSLAAEAEEVSRLYRQVSASLVELDVLVSRHRVSVNMNRLGDLREERGNSSGARRAALDVVLEAAEQLAGLIAQRDRAEAEVFAAFAELPTVVAQSERQAPATSGAESGIGRARRGRTPNRGVPLVPWPGDGSASAVPMHTPPPMESGGKSMVPEAFHLAYDGVSAERDAAAAELAHAAAEAEADLAALKSDRFEQELETCRQVSGYEMADGLRWATLRYRETASMVARLEQLGAVSPTADPRLYELLSEHGFRVMRWYSALRIWQEHEAAGGPSRVWTGRRGGFPESAWTACPMWWTVCRRSFGSRKSLSRIRRRRWKAECPPETSATRAPCRRCGTCRRTGEK